MPRPDETRRSSQPEPTTAGDSVASPSLSVRPYRTDDRDAVRRICFETGFMGEPVAWLYPDASSFADLFCTWYVDHEPEHAWVVDDGTGRAVGYLLGAADTRKVPSPVRPALRHVVGRGLAVRGGTRVFWGRAVTDVIRARGHVQPAVDVDRWPAHLHIDLLPEARGRGLGAELVRTWREELSGLGVAGLHLTTFTENAPAHAFFRAQGFTPHGPSVPAPGFRDGEGRPLHACAFTLDRP